MPTYIGENKIVDRYLGNRFLEAAYIGDQKVYDPYTEITGNLPIVFKSRAAVALKNYHIYGTAEGAGVETENLWNPNAKDTSNGYMNGCYLRNNNRTEVANTWCVSEYIEVAPNTQYTLKWTTAESPSAMLPSICQYDANKDFISNSGTSYDANNTVTITTTATTKYIRFSGVISRWNVETIRFNLGSTVIDVPPGYKLPLTVESGETENLFDINTTWYKQNPNDVIEIGENEVTITANLYDYVKIDVEANTDYTLNFEYQYLVGSMHRATVTTQDLATIILRIDGTSGTFNTGSNTSIAILFYAGGGSKGKTKYKSIMLVKETAVPSSYIPHRYTSDIPIYIGSSKLAEEEYVDYGEQKVYKRTENLWDWKNKTINQGTFFVSERYTLKPNTTYTMSSEAPLYNYGALIVIGIPGESSATSTNGVYQDHPITRTTGADGIVFIGLRTNNSSYDLTQFKTCLTESSTPPETYIPYLQPTDPPVPLSPIPTYKGENTLDTETAPNVFDYSSLVMGSINVPGGEEVTSNTHKRTPYIEVDAGSVYILQNILSGGAIRIHQYTSNSSAGWTRSDLFNEGSTVSLDATTKYVRMVATVDTYQSDTYFGLGKYAVGTAVIKGRINEIN